MALLPRAFWQPLDLAQPAELGSPNHSAGSPTGAQGKRLCKGFWEHAVRMWKKSREAAFRSPAQSSGCRAWLLWCQKAVISARAKEALASEGLSIPLSQGYSVGLQSRSRRNLTLARPGSGGTLNRHILGLFVALPPPQAPGEQPYLAPRFRASCVCGTRVCVQCTRVSAVCTYMCACAPSLRGSVLLLGLLLAEPPRPEAAGDPGPGEGLVSGPHITACFQVPHKEYSSEKHGPSPHPASPGSQQARELSCKACGQDP